VPRVPPRAVPPCPGRGGRYTLLARLRGASREGRQEGPKGENVPPGMKQSGNSSYELKALPMRLI